MNMHEYWERRYRETGSSGPGSRGTEAAWKARLLQRVIDVKNVKSLLDLGSGDGHVASMIRVPYYVGYEPSESARKIAQEMMPSRTFTANVPKGPFDLVVSMDVIFHQVTEELYREYLDLLFSDRSDLVFVYGTDHVQKGASHVLHRHWTPDIPEGWVVEELPARFKRAWLIARS